MTTHEAVRMKLFDMRIFRPDEEINNLIFNAEFLYDLDTPVRKVAQLIAGILEVKYDSRTKQCYELAQILYTGFLEEKAELLYQVQNN